MSEVFILALALLSGDVEPSSRKMDDVVLARDCIAEENDADRFVAGCWYEQALIWEKRVEQNYVAALRRVDPEMRHPVERAQRAWRVYARAACSQWDKVQGSVAVRLQSQCALNQAKRRAVELQEIDGLSG